MVDAAAAAELGARSQENHGPRPGQESPRNNDEKSNKFLRFFGIKKADSERAQAGVLRGSAVGFLNRGRHEEKTPEKPQRVPVVIAAYKAEKSPAKYSSVSANEKLGIRHFYRRGSPWGVSWAA